MLKIEKLLQVFTWVEQVLSAARLGAAKDGRKNQKVKTVWCEVIVKAHQMKRPSEKELFREHFIGMLH